MLKSWAVPEGPSLIPGKKRLAVHVEDHPLEYGGFEGVIPEGEYGAGTVMVWDRGTWTPEFDPEFGYARATSSSSLQGEKLKGAWHLVRMARKPREKQEAWLLFKSDDEAARPADAPDILAEMPRSAATGREHRGDRPRAGPGVVIEAGRRASSQKKRAPQAGRRSGDTAQGEGRRAAELRRALAAVADREGAVRRRLGPRDQVRRLSRPGAHRERPRRVADAHRASTGPNAFPSSPRRSRALPVKVGAHRRRGRGADGGRRRQLHRAGRRAEDRQAATSSSTPSTCSISTASTCAMRRSRSARRRWPRSSPRTARTAASATATTSPGDGDTVFRHASRLGLEGIVSKKLSSPYRSGRVTSWVKLKVDRSAGRS